MIQIRIFLIFMQSVELHLKNNVLMIILIRSDGCVWWKHTLTSTIFYQNAYIVYQNRNPNHIAHSHIQVQQKIHIFLKQHFKRVLRVRTFPYLLWTFPLNILINQAKCVHNSDTYILNTIDPIKLRALVFQRKKKNRFENGKFGKAFVLKNHWRSCAVLIAITKSTGFLSDGVNVISIVMIIIQVSRF